MLTHRYIFFLILVFALPCRSQEIQHSGGTNDIEWGSLLWHWLSHSGPTTVEFQQQGASNEAVIQQVTTDPYKASNTVNFQQDGTGNTLSLRQEGNDNRASTYQRGVRNSIELSMLGDENRAFASQVGTNNNIRKDIIGDDTFFGILQIGNGNVYEQINTSYQPNTYQVTQRGNDMKLIIFNGPRPASMQ